MAFTYRYELSAGLAGLAPDLREYEAALRDSLQAFFDVNGYHVRNIQVYPTAYSFALLPDAASPGLLSAMGRWLKSRPGMAGFYAPLQQAAPAQRHYFSAAPRRYIALVYPMADGSLDLDMTDITDILDETELNSVQQIHFTAQLSTFHARVFTPAAVRRIRRAADKAGGWVTFYGSPQRRRPTLEGWAAELYAAPDYGYLAWLQNSQLAMEGFEQLPEYRSRLAIAARSIQPADAQQVAALLRRTELKLEQADSIPQLAAFPGPGYRLLRVHDVGQGLACSVSEQAKPLPLLYFDYGMDLWNPRAVGTVPRRMPVAAGTPIVLSHTHSDHWHAAGYNIGAFHAAWYLPGLGSSLKLRCFLAQVLLAGGSVYRLRGTTATADGSLAIHRCPDGGTPHRGGLCMALTVGGPGSQHRVLVPGDEEYTNLPPEYTADVQVLVATHHGGCYGGTHRDIPGAEKAETVVYSYGAHNPYGQPTHLQDYRLASWGVEHHTARHGEYHLP